MKRTSLVAFSDPMETYNNDVRINPGNVVEFDRALIR